MGDAFQSLSTIVTTLGIILSLLSMMIIFLGKKIQGTSGKQQVTYKGFEIRTDAVILLIIVSVFAASSPLYLQFKYRLQIDPAEIANLKNQLASTKEELNKLKEAKTDINVYGIFHDGASGQPLGGARIRVLRTSVIPSAQVAILGPTNDQGSLTQTLQLQGPNDRLSLIAEKEGYNNQDISISAGYITFPANLIKKK